MINQALKLINKTIKKYSISKEFRQSIADSNTKHLLIVTAVLFVITFVGFFVYFIRNQFDIHDRKMIYFLLFYLENFIFLVWSAFVTILHSASYVVKSILVYLALSVVLLLFSYTVFFLNEDITFYFVFYTVTMMCMILYFSLSVLFNIFTIGFGLFCFNHIISVTRVDIEPFNLYLYFFAFLVLVFFKLKVTSNILNQKKILDEQQVNLDRQTKNLAKYKERIEYELQAKIRNEIEDREKNLQFQKNAIISLANLTENRGVYSEEHLHRISACVECLCKKTRNTGFYRKELTDKFISIMLDSVCFHDIGKIKIPDAILKKTKPLSENEYKIIKNHSLEGGKIIQEMFKNENDKLYIRIVSNLVVFHHERYDGSGYPFGLAGDKIPLSARIMAIIDVFDALISSRPYRNAISVDDAFEIMKNGSGTQFDPVLIEQFLSLKAEIINILIKYND